MDTPSTDRVKVLIVEDDPIIAYDIKVILQSENYSVVATVHNAVMAKDIIGKTDIDLVILDINLGIGENGIDISFLLKKLNIPFIFLTSYSDKTTVSKASEQNPSGYLVKPFQEATLISTLTIALKNRESKKDKISKNLLKLNLTDRETDLIHLIIAGKSYQEMADEMYISINTIRYHIKNLYLKCDVKGSNELITRVMDIT